MLKTVKIITFLLFVKTIDAIDYCDVTLCIGGSKHIACKNNGNFAPTCPSDRAIIAFSNSEIVQILDVHNTLRNKIASGSESGFKSASKMTVMSWNQELADLAALNVKQCKMEHDQCRSTLQFKFAGQNIGYRANSQNFEGITTFLNNVIWAWYNEIKDAQQSQIDSCCGGTNFSKIGHFLQIIQDRAAHIGCAAARYTNGQWKTILFTCNYSFTNFVDQKVYQTGNAASTCTNGKSSKYPALCN